MLKPKQERRLNTQKGFKFLQCQRDEKDAHLAKCQTLDKGGHFLLLKLRKESRNCGIYEIKDSRG